MSDECDNFIKHRDGLYEVQKKSQDDYDKLLFAVSSGALGTSFVFVKDFLGNNIVFPWCLFGAWLFWGLAIVFNLYSYYSSALAHVKAIKQWDAKYLNDQAKAKSIKQSDVAKASEEISGGYFGQITSFLNGLGGVCFLVGVVLIAIFVKYNLEEKYMSKEQTPKPIHEGQEVKAPPPSKGMEVKPPPPPESKPK